MENTPPSRKLIAPICLYLVTAFFASSYYLADLIVQSDLRGITTFGFLWNTYSIGQSTRLLMMMAIAGTLGGLLFTITSFTAHVGRKTFDPHWIPWTLLRPVTGAILALAIYFATRGSSNDDSIVEGQYYGYLGLAILSGLFSAHATEKLRQLFNTLFGMKTPKKADETHNEEKPTNTAEPDETILEEALEFHRQSLLEQPGILSVGMRPPGMVDQSPAAIKVRGSKAALDALPDQLEYADKKGDTYTFALVKTPSNGAQLHAKLSMGSCIANQSSSSIKGAAGAVVYENGAQRVLTCDHVIDPRNKIADQDTPATNYEIVNCSNEPVGRFLRGVHNPSVDAALVIPEAPVDPSIAGIGIPQTPRTLTWKDVKAKLPLRMYSPERGLQEGVLTDLSVHEYIYSDHQEKIKMVHLIEVYAQGAKPFSVPGDSGSLVVDEAGHAVGLLVAGEPAKNRALIVPFRFIAQQLNITIQPNPSQS